MTARWMVATLLLFVAVASATPLFDSRRVYEALRSQAHDNTRPAVVIPTISPESAEQAVPAQSIQKPIVSEEHTPWLVDEPKPESPSFYPDPVDEVPLPKDAPPPGAHPVADIVADIRAIKSIINTEIQRIKAKYYETLAPMA